MDLLPDSEQAALSTALGQSLAKIAQQLGLPVKVAAAVSQERAQRAMDRLSSMEDTKPTGGQVARYAGIGGGGGAATAALSNIIEGYTRQPHGPGLRGHLSALGRAAVRADKNPGVGDKLRSVAATAVKGALGAGVLPLVRSGTDRGAERKVLRKYINQYEPSGMQLPPTPSQPPVTNA